MGQQTIPLLFLAVSPSKKPWRLFWPRYFRGRNKRHIVFSLSVSPCLRGKSFIFAFI